MINCDNTGMRFKRINAKHNPTIRPMIMATIEIIIVLGTPLSTSIIVYKTKSK